MEAPRVRIVMKDGEQEFVRLVHLIAWAGKSMSGHWVLFDANDVESIEFLPDDE